ncbi:MAG TPA: proton-conducting transporter membrane subunit [Terriglobales bacterium]|nr:proton-conducting transporter membrane subunit [Terriglobales bacterium]
MTANIPLTILVLIGVGAPALLFALLGIAAFVDRSPSEAVTGRLTALAMALSCATLFSALVSLLAGSGMRFLTYGGWSHAGGIAVQFLVDRLSLAFAALSAAILGIVAAFSHRYLHREPGFHRYFVLLAMFATGMELIALAGNVEVLFIGWELVGLSSALLIAFFHERPAPLVNGLRVFSVYRISDAALLSAAVMLQLRAGDDGLAMLFSGGPAHAHLGGAAATAIAVLLIVAVAGKSALIPFSGWLPRAMDGPTPSSAVYYGALSVHAGCFLLLRAMPLLAHAPAARILAGVLGAATAAFAAATTRVQSDVKSSLAYASLTQVGLIVVEIALGWQLLAFLHIAGHMCLRLLQLLSAPNVLHDLHGLSGNATRRRPWLSRMLPERYGRRIYLFALERGFLDSLLDQAVVHPLLNAARRLSRVDARLCGAVLAASTPPADGGEDE